MANAREIKKRIRSIKSTAKITRTMEMVATAKSKKAFDRINDLKPYASSLHELIVDLLGSGDTEHPLLRDPQAVSHTTLVVITANRGLCGGFNTNILRQARLRLEEIQSKNLKYRLVVIGKKGVSFFRFLGYEVHEAHTNFDEKVSYNQTCEVADSLTDSFIQNQTDQIEIYSNRLRGAGSVIVGSEVMLPFKIDASSRAEKRQVSYLFSPPAEVILGDLLPLSVKTTFFRAVIESMAAELIARRIAMKNATDAANDMYRDLTGLYNRSRQAGITQEISEIVGGAEALK